MKKIKITVDQTRGLEEYKTMHNGLTSNEMFEIALDEVDDNDKLYYISAPLKYLNGIDIKDFYFLLNGWYEVEHYLHIGDWVHNNNGRYYKIVDGQSSDIRTLDIHVARGYKNTKLTVVTNPFEIKLLELGRKKPVLEVGDVYIDKSNECWHVDSEDFLRDYCVDGIKDNYIKVLFPKEIGITK